MRDRVEFLLILAAFAAATFLGSFDPLPFAATQAINPQQTQNALAGLHGAVKLTSIALGFYVAHLVLIALRERRTWAWAERLIVLLFNLLVLAWFAYELIVKEVLALTH